MERGGVGAHSSGSYAARVPTHRRIAVVALAVYSTVLLGVLLSPSSAPGSTAVDRVTALLVRLDVPVALADPTRVEFLLNVAIFVPWAALAATVWPPLGWRDWTAYGFVATAAIETVQALALDGRSATFSDVSANTLGTLVGALAVTAVRRWNAGRDAAATD